MSGGAGHCLNGYLPVGSRVLIERDGYRGSVGVFRGRGKKGKLLVLVGSTRCGPMQTILHCRPDELRRVREETGQ